MNPVGIFGNNISKCPDIKKKKGHLSLFTGCLLARVMRSKLISVQLDHPVPMSTPKSRPSREDACYTLKCWVNAVQDLTRVLDVIEHDIQDQQPPDPHDDNQLPQMQLKPRRSPGPATERWKGSPQEALEGTWGCWWGNQGRGRGPRGPHKY